MKNVYNFGHKKKGASPITISKEKLKEIKEFMRVYMEGNKCKKQQ